jgi:GntR family transcriptional regulator
MSDENIATAFVLEEESGVPLYVQLREQLRTEIQAGRWGPGERLPTEESFSDALGISRSTIRQALSDLTRDGLIVRRAGRGSFPARPRMILRMQHFMSLSEEMRERGVEPSSRLLGLEVLGKDDSDVGLDLDEGGDAVISVRTLRMADGSPVVLFEHRFPKSLCGFLLDEELDTSHLSIHEIMTRHGIVPSNATGEVTATVAGAAEAQLLELEPGAALIEMTTRVSDAGGRVVEWSRALVRTDRYALVLESDWKVR